MKIAICGSTGFLGRALAEFFEKQGWDVVRVTRHEMNMLTPSYFEGCDVVVNAVGESILGRWTPKKKRKMVSSRIESTKLICETILKCKKKAIHYVGLSAIGYYGKGFLADLCHEWEAAAKACQTSTFLRLGVVLDKSGGMLKLMLPLFKWGLGGKIGSGAQMMSWIALEDVLWGCKHVIEKRLEGPLVFAAPQPVSNAEFTSALGKYVHRPTFFTVPAWVLKRVFGKECAEEVFLSSYTIVPDRLLETEYSFRTPTLASFFRL